MHRFAHGVVAAKGKGNVADAAADLGARQVLLDPARRLDEIDRVIVVLLHPGADGQNVRIKNNVLAAESRTLRSESYSCARKCSLRRSSVSAWPRSSKAITTTAAP